MSFITVAEVNAYYDSIPPLDIPQREIDACGDDGLAIANLMIQSLSAYMRTYSRPMDWPAAPPRRRNYLGRLPLDFRFCRKLRQREDRR